MFRVEQRCLAFQGDHFEGTPFGYCVQVFAMLYFAGAYLFLGRLELDLRDQKIAVELAHLQRDFVLCLGELDLCVLDIGGSRAVRFADLEHLGQRLFQLRAAGVGGRCSLVEEERFRRDGSSGCG